MAAINPPASALKPIDSLVVEVITDDVSDTYVSKTLFAVSEFSNVVMAGAKVISGEALLCANLGFGLKLVSEAENARHTLLFDTGPEGTIFIRNCANLGIRLGEVESVAVSHGHWDHMAALPHAVEAIVKDGGRVAVHVNPDMFNERAIRLKSGMVVPVANSRANSSSTARRWSTPRMLGCCSTTISITAGRYRGSHRSRKVASTISRARVPPRRGNPIRCSWMSACWWRTCAIWD
jgi:hypothetical protein